MDHQLIAFCFHDDELEEVPGVVRADDEVPRRVVAEFGPRESVLVGVLDVVVGDSVSARRRWISTRNKCTTIIRLTARLRSSHTGVLRGPERPCAAIVCMAFDALDA
ncbi:MAG: hypothetical protein ACYDC0_14395 [Acidimicrobiales bacterium]